jgi:hypothetical protein
MFGYLKRLKATWVSLGGVSQREELEKSEMTLRGITRREKRTTMLAH